MAKRSRLESLPTEIISDIFLIEPNLELGHASPYLGAVLSSQYIYRALLRAYFPPPYFKPGERSWARIPEISGSREEILQRRRRLLDFRWVTARLMKDVLENDRILHRILQIPCPPRLLKGPWTEDKLEFLKLLDERANIFHRYRGHSSRKYTKILTQGLADAIAENFEPAVEALLGTPLANNFDAPFHGKLIKLAMMTETCSTRIVGALVRSAWSWGMRNWKMPEVDAWLAVNKIGVQERRAEWTRAVLDSLRNGLYPDSLLDQPCEPLMDRLSHIEYVVRSGVDHRRPFSRGDPPLPKNDFDCLPFRAQWELYGYRFRVREPLRGLVAIGTGPDKMDLNSQKNRHMERRALLTAHKKGWDCW